MKKTIKAWAVIDLRKGYKQVFFTEWLTDGIQNNIFGTLKDARKYHKWTHLKHKMKIIPCQITYQVPTKHKR